MQALLAPSWVLLVVALGGSCAVLAPIQARGPAGPASKAVAAAGGWTPIELAATDQSQLFGARTGVIGLRTALWSASNRKVHGVDFVPAFAWCGGGSGIKACAQKPTATPFLRLLQQLDHGLPHR